MEKIYLSRMSLKVANEKGKQVNFCSRADDIIKAVYKFNEYFKFKEVKISNVAEKYIDFLFYIRLASPSVPVSARDLSYLSKRLAHDYSFSSYSRESSKLFKSDIFEDVTHDYLRNWANVPVVPDNVEKLIQESSELSLTDEQAIKSFEALINIQGIGNEDTVRLKKQAVNKIKAILLECFS